jgi:transcriptional regulator with XRE-family HTH domain/Zn-dependent peptidase ImmA (M78 family)
MADANDWDEVGERVRRTRLTAGLSQVDLAKLVGLDRTMIAKIEAGTRRIDALELTRLSTALAVPLDYLLRPLPRVLSHRSSILDDDTDSEVARETGRLEIILASWLCDVRQLVGLDVLRPQPLLTSERLVDSPDAARGAALGIRDRLGYGLAPIGALVELCEKAGQFVLVADVPGEGASVIDGDIAAAVVSVWGDPGRRRATAAHELGHLVIGDEYSSDLGIHAARADREAVVDAFAVELLLPTEVLLRTKADSGTPEVSRARLIDIAARYRTSWTLALRQAEHAGAIDRQARYAMARSAPTRSEFMEALGWAPQPDLESIRVPPGYAHAVIQALRRDAITASRAVELMHGQLSLADLPAESDTDDAP